MPHTTAQSRKLAIGAAFDWKAITARISAGGHVEAVRDRFDALVTLHIQTGAVDLTTYLSPGECLLLAEALQECAKVAQELAPMPAFEVEAA